MGTLSARSVVFSIGGALLLAVTALALYPPETAEKNSAGITQTSAVQAVPAVTERELLNLREELLQQQLQLSDLTRKVVELETALALKNSHSSAPGSEPREQDEYLGAQDNQAAGPASRNVAQAISTSPRETFEAQDYAWSTSDTLADGIETAFSSSELGSFDLGYTECRESICRVSYAPNTADRSAVSMAAMELPGMIARSLGQDVTIIHLEEYGEQVLYVQR